MRMFRRRTRMRPSNFPAFGAIYHGFDQDWARSACELIASFGFWLWLVAF
jgi:hypothetical protein